MKTTREMAEELAGWRTRKLSEGSTFRCSDCGMHCDAGTDKCPKCDSEEISVTNDESKVESIVEALLELELK